MKFGKALFLPLALVALSTSAAPPEAPSGPSAIPEGLRINPLPQRPKEAKASQRPEPDVRTSQDVAALRDALRSALEPMLGERPAAKASGPSDDGFALRSRIGRDVSL